jgi:ABC-type multidrug transport system fused ATPase/permease subunit
MGLYHINTFFPLHASENGAMILFLAVGGLLFARSLGGLAQFLLGIVGFLIVGAGAFFFDLMLGSPLTVIGVFEAIVGMYLILIFLRYLVHRRNQEQLTTQFTASADTAAVVYSIEVPPKTPYNPNAARALVEQLAGIFSNNVAFRLSTENGKVTFELIDFCPLANRGNPTLAITSAYGPDTKVNSHFWTPTQYTDHTCYHYLAPLLHGSQFEGKWYISSIHLTEAPEDPLTYLVHTIGEATKSGVVTNLTFALASADFGKTSTRKEARRIIQGLPSEGEKLTKGVINFVWHVIMFVFNLFLAAFASAIFEGKSRSSGGWVGGGDIAPVNYPTLSMDPIQKRFLDKTNSPTLYALQLVLEIYGDNAALVAQTAGHISSLLDNQYRGEVAGMGIRRKSIMGNAMVRKVDSQAQLDAYSLSAYFDYLHNHPSFIGETRAVLTSDELAALWHLPHVGMAEEYVTFSAKGQPSAAILRNTQGVTIGINGDNQIRLPDIGDPKHTNIVGKSGTGKSTLMLNLIHHDIKSGRGVAVIDPHGDLIKSILRSSIPEQRIDDVVVIDIAYEEHPMPLNPLYLPDVKEQVAADQVEAILQRTYDFANAPRALHVLNYALRALRFVPHATVRDAVRFLDDVEWRLKVLQQYGKDLDEACHEFWEHHNQKPQSEFESLVDPVVRRLQSLYETNHVYFMTCHPETLKWAELVTGRKIILVSLKANGSKVGPLEQKMLGTLVLSQLDAAASNSGWQEMGFRLYVDEANQFVTTSMNKMFEGIRKRGVWMTIANQYLDQLKGDVLKAVMGNVTTTIVFEVARDDGQELEAYVKPEFEMENLVKLGRHRAVIQTIINDAPQPAFVVDTLPPPPEPEKKVADALEARIRQRSIDLYTPMTKDAVKKWLDERYPRRGFTVPKDLRKGNNTQENEWDVPNGGI